MTDKELLYVEDALNHAKHFNEMCNEACELLDDVTLKNFVFDVQKEIQMVYSNIFATLRS